MAGGAWQYRNLVPAPAQYQSPRSGKLIDPAGWSQFSQQLAADLAESWHNVRADLASHGVPLVVTGIMRSYADQADLRRRKPTLAAIPGTSWHEAGRAVDLNLAVMCRSIPYPALRALMASHGWRTLPWVVSRGDREAWHYQHITRQPAHGDPWEPWIGGVQEAIAWVRYRA